MIDGDCRALNFTPDIEARLAGREFPGAADNIVISGDGSRAEIADAIKLVRRSTVDSQAAICRPATADSPRREAAAFRGQHLLRSSKLRVVCASRTGPTVGSMFSAIQASVDVI